MSSVQPWSALFPFRLPSAIYLAMSCANSGKASRIAETLEQQHHRISRCDASHWTRGVPVVCKIPSNAASAVTERSDLSPAVFRQSPAPFPRNGQSKKNPCAGGTQSTRQFTSQNASRLHARQEQSPPPRHPSCLTLSSSSSLPRRTSGSASSQAKSRYRAPAPAAVQSEAS
eukprot:scaffold1944_cov241-Pinguiococcus_pyrenoidosus.AAC.13